MIYFRRTRGSKLLLLLGLIFLVACLPEKDMPTPITSTITPPPTKTPQPTHTNIPFTPTPPVKITRDILYVEPLQKDVSEQRLDVYALYSVLCRTTFQPVEKPLKVGKCRVQYCSLYQPEKRQLYKKMVQQDT